MAARTSKKRTTRKTSPGRPPKSTEEHGSSAAKNDAVAVLMIGVALLLFLGLVSFDTGDLPAWTKLNKYSEPVSPAENFVGPVGALAGLALYLLFGASAFLIPAVMVWFGAAKLIAHIRIGPRMLTGAAGLILCSCALLHLQPYFLQEKNTVFHKLTATPGGMFGELIGGTILQALLGTIGASLVLAMLYMVCLILLTGFHPLTFMHQLGGAIRSGLAWINTTLAERSERRADRRERIRQALQEEEEDADIVEPPKPKRKRAPRKKKQPEPEPIPEDDSFADDEDDDAPTEELPLKYAPKRKIIDASTRRSNNGVSQTGKLEFTNRPAAGLESAEFPNYELPPLSLLSYDEDAAASPADTSQLTETQDIIVDTLSTFGIEVTPGDITRGPTITRYEIYPGRGLRVNRITALEADLARATRAERINIIAPIPGKDTVGIEIANDDKTLVQLRELLEDEKFSDPKKRIPLALGKDVYGNAVIGDLAAMPHLLVAGATGAGKSVCINSIITSILYKFSPDDLRFIMIDPKVVEMADYNVLPHLVVPVVNDPKKTLLALRWVVNEMERRYQMFAKVGVRNFETFNKREPVKKDVPANEFEIEEPESEEVDEDAIEDLARALEEGDITPPDPEEDDLFNEDAPIPDRIPYIVVIIDELADLMQTAPAEVEQAIARIAQKARAAGIHLIVATQTPRADVVTGIIKANIPTRIAFQVSSKIDSRVILDTSGADKLVGKGDMLFLPPGSAKLVRSQGAFLDDEEVRALVAHCASQGEQKFEETIQEAIDNPDASEESVSDEDEELIERTLQIIASDKRASTSHIQRRLGIGYNRAARMMDILEQRGVLGPSEGAKPREILVDLSRYA
ncbi:DNA translocase FtsK [Sulfuriroseicoccus oceanibius]|uniref:DNA translocase FtsK n=1 Tax=Sulfuriroseicoccus oceanibius TaxID=2707525 RepID=A0A6B3LAL2_9BACT|nr:DNA translocase FtsK [Sulfuriroseicoccus oceanibius]QQL43887.1 DNA translocase FtsK [Sulfuriroseicoccus oceanibius]